MKAALRDKIASCRIIVANEVLGTHTETLSPQSPDEAMKNQGDVSKARAWLDYYNTDSLAVEELLGGPQPIAVAVHKKAHEIVVHWYATGDQEAARAAMQNVFDGKWEGGLLS